MPLIPADLHTSCLPKRNKIVFQLPSPSIFDITKQEFSLLLDSAVSGELFVWTCWSQLFSHQTKTGQTLTSNRQVLFEKKRTRYMTVHTGHVLAIYLHVFFFYCSCTYSKHILMSLIHFGFWSPVQTRSDFCMCFVYSAQYIKKQQMAEYQGKSHSFIEKQKYTQSAAQLSVSDNCLSGKIN